MTLRDLVLDYFGDADAAASDQPITRISTSVVVLGGQTIVCGYNVAFVRVDDLQTFLSFEHASPIELTGGAVLDVPTHLLLVWGNRVGTDHLQSNMPVACNEYHVNGWPIVKAS